MRPSPATGMKTLKEARRVASVIGDPNCWSIAPPDSRVAGLHQVIFRVFIQSADSEKDVGFLLCYEAESGGYSADEWFPMLSEAERAAFDLFGIAKSDWSFAN